MLIPITHVALLLYYLYRACDGCSIAAHTVHSSHRTSKFLVCKAAAAPQTLIPRPQTLRTTKTRHTPQARSPKLKPVNAVQEVYRTLLSLHYPSRVQGL